MESPNLLRDSKEKQLIRGIVDGCVSKADGTRKARNCLTTEQCNFLNTITFLVLAWMRYTEKQIS